MNYDAFHKAVDLLVRHNLELRSEHSRSIERMSTETYLKEFGTVQVNAGRRSGKTEYIKRRAQSGDVVVGASYAIGAMAFPGAPFSVLTPRDLVDNGCDVRHPIVFVDEPELVFRHIRRAHLYSVLGKDNRQTFILLGA